MVTPLIFIYFSYYIYSPRPAPLLKCIYRQKNKGLPQQTISLSGTSLFCIILSYYYRIVKRLFQFCVYHNNIQQQNMIFCLYFLKRFFYSIANIKFMYMSNFIIFKISLKSTTQIICYCSC